MIASEQAALKGLSPYDVLILQGDADTIYEPGYVHAMRQAALAGGLNRVLEARTHSPRRFLHDHPGFQQLADLVDKEMASSADDDAEDVIVDDKVAGFRLGDYQRWGGHRRDYMSTGAEVHAETTRLFIRARRLGARKMEVDQAWALPSRRKIQRNPVRHFATAGFPREEAWWRTWNADYSGPNDLSAFDDLEQHAALEPAIAMRRAHLFALFTSIPRAVAEALGRTDTNPAIDARAIAAVRHLDEDNLGRFFEVLLPATHFRSA